MGALLLVPAPLPKAVVKVVRKMPVLLPVSVRVSASDSPVVPLETVTLTVWALPEAVFWSASVTWTVTELPTLNGLGVMVTEPLTPPCAVVVDVTVAALPAAFFASL